MKLNEKLLRQVQTLILKQPKRFDMAVWLMDLGDCGTVGCIAGWTCVLGGKPKVSTESFGHFVERTAMELLGCDMTDSWSGPLERDAFGNLFRFDMWPKSRYDEFVSAKTPEEKAEATARCIEDFIQKYGDKGGSHEP